MHFNKKIIAFLICGKATKIMILLSSVNEGRSEMKLRKLVSIISLLFVVALPVHAQSLFTFEKIAETGDEMPGNPGVYFGGAPAFSNPSLDGSYLSFIGAADGAHGFADLVDD